jgi:hypothetical protein
MATVSLEAGKPIDFKAVSIALLRCIFGGGLAVWPSMLIF